MHILRNLGRVTAIVVSAAWMLAPTSASAGALKCTSASLSVLPNSDGSLSVSCTDVTTTSTSCTVTASSTLLPSSGGQVTVTASNCGTISSWTGAVAVTPGTAASFTDTLPANSGTTTKPYTYTVTGTGTPTTAAVTVNVAAPSTTTTPPPTGAVDCTAQGYATKNITIPWGAIGTGNVRVTTSGFTNGMIYVASITTPSVPLATTSTLYAKISSAESNSATGPIIRTAWFSDNPTSACQFTSPNPMGTYANIVGATSPNLTYQVNGTSTYYPVLKPGKTYYFSIKNEYKGSPTCPAKFGSCDMYIELAKPTGSGW